jgi:hypothetical protein
MKELLVIALAAAALIAAVFLRVDKLQSREGCTWESTP